MSIEKNKKVELNLHENKKESKHILDTKIKLYDILFGNILSNLKIKDLSDEIISFLNGIISYGANKKIKDIDNIFKEVSKLDNLYENETAVFLMAVLFGYYLDNNFLNKLNKFIAQYNLDLSLLEEKIHTILNDYKNTEFYILISKNIQGFLFYLDITKKERILKNNNLDNFYTDIKSRLSYLIGELDYLLQNNSSHSLYLNYLNTLLSYYGYDLIYLDYLPTKNKDYFQKLLTDQINKHINYINSNKKKFKGYLLSIFLTHLVFYSKVLDLNDYSFLLDKIRVLNEDKYFYLYNYVIEYSGINLDETAKYEKLVLNKEIPNLRILLSNDLADKFSVANILSRSSYFQNIRLVNSIFEKFLITLFGKDILSSFDSIKNKEIFYMDGIYYFLKNKVSSMIGFDDKKIYNLFKSFLIKYVGLNTNLSNIDFNFTINTNVNSRLERFFVLKKSNKSFTKSISVKYNFNGLKVDISIYLFDELTDEEVYKEKLLSNKIKSFIYTIIEKILSLNSFLNSVDTKVNILKKHPETIRHMEKMANLIEILQDTNKLEKLKNTIPVSDKDFLLLLGYLHDIGKADNIEILNLYEIVNTRIDPYFTFIQFLERQLNKDIPISNIENTKNSGIQVRDIYTTISESKEFKKICKDFFMEIKRFTFQSIGDISYYENILLKYAIDMYSFLSRKLKDFNIEYEIFKENSCFNRNFRKMSSELDYNIFFLGVLLLFIAISEKQKEEITHPHITYGLQFFQLHPEYNYLSFVLYHHNNYPTKKEILYYEGDKGLNKYKSILGLKNKYLENIDLDQAIRLEDKDYLMVLLTTCDLVDALLSGRKYQKSVDLSKFSVLSILSDEFKKELNKIFTIEDNSNLDRVFDKVISILDKEFSNNIHYKSKIRLKLLSQKDKILSMYRK